MSTQFHWSSKRYKAALALAEGQSKQAVAEAIGVCRKTICNWLCVTAFVAEVDRLSCMIDVASRAERLRMAMRVVRQRTRADGTLETDKDLLDWLNMRRVKQPESSWGLHAVRLPSWMLRSTPLGGKQ